MEKLVCTQCGAPINPETFNCDYCGSVFLSSEKIQMKYSKKNQAKDSGIIVPQITNSDLNGLIKKHLNNVNKGTIPAILFMIIWTGIAFSMFGTITNMFNPFKGGPPVFVSFVPLAMAIFGMIIIIINFTKLPWFKWNSIYRLLDAGDYKNAYEEIGKFEQKRHNVSNIYAQILIGYYRLDKFAEVKNTIISMPSNELANMLNSSMRILNIAESLNIKTPEFNHNTQTLNNGNFDNYNIYK